MKKQIFVLIIGLALLSGTTDAMKRKRTTQANRELEVEHSPKRQKLTIKIPKRVTPAHTPESEEPITPKKLNLRRLISSQKEAVLERAIATLTAISWDDLQTFKQMFQAQSRIIGIRRLVNASINGMQLFFYVSIQDNIPWPLRYDILNYLRETNEIECWMPYREGNTLTLYAYFSTHSNKHVRNWFNKIF